MKAALLALCLIAPSSTQAHADVLVKHYQATMSGGNEAAIQSVTNYIFGIASGVMAANAASSSKSVPLFCPPGALVINGDNFIDILNKTIKRFGEIGYPDLGDAPISLILLRGLISTFPCPAK